jgi:hypothetical protein
MAVEAHTGKLPHELMLEWAQTGLMEVKEQVANGCSVKKYVVLSVSERINLTKACAPYYAPKIIGQKKPGSDDQAAETKHDNHWVTEEPLRKGDKQSSKAHTGKLPHELMLEWAQSGLMEVPQRVANGRFVKEYVVLPVSRRINLAKACARYYARKLVGQEQPCRGAAAHTGPHELMWEWVQIAVMEVPEQVKKGYFVKRFVALSLPRCLNLAKACAPYSAAKIT